MSLKGKTVLGAIWTFGGQVISTVILFVANIVLAKQLDPSDFGRMGIVLFFTTIFSVFTESGFGGALIRKPDTNRLDYSTVFVFNLIVSLFFIFLTILISPFIAKFYHDESLQNLLIASSLILLLNAFQITQNAKMIKLMRFNRIYIYTISSTILSTIISIYCAFLGFGVWSLVILQVGVVFFNTLFTNIFEGVFIQFKFSKNSFSELYAFGLNTTLASLIDKGFDNVYQLILAKNFSTIQTGFYYQAKKLIDAPGAVLNGVSQSVIFSALIKVQNDNKKLNNFFIYVLTIYSVTLGLFGLITYCFGRDIILVVFGDKWLGSVFYLQILGFVSFFYIQELLLRVIFKVHNKTKLILFLEIIKKSIQTVTILIGLYFKDIEILIIGFLVSSFLGFLIYFFVAKNITKFDNMKGLVNIIKIVISILIILFFREILSLEEMGGMRGILINFFFVVLLYISLLWISGILKNLFKDRFSVN